jgi:hypothetical protein
VINNNATHPLREHPPANPVRTLQDQHIHPCLNQPQSSDQPRIPRPGNDDLGHPSTMPQH